MGDEHDLRRFVDAQESGGTYAQALEELRAGRKTTHWIWFVFPQIAGLGRSETARAYAIASVEEARAYLEHPLLGPRLRESSQALLDLEGGSARGILGEVDAAKLRSSMTLFAHAARTSSSSSGCWTGTTRASATRRPSAGSDRRRGLASPARARAGAGGPRPSA
jgi:uncharacterized protein (DUF1810 family)